MTPELQEKVVIVTGAGAGLGAAFARHAAEAGAKVVVNDIDKSRARAVAKSIAASGQVAVADCHSVAKMDEAEALVEHAIDTFGVVDGLVNNAGIWRDGSVAEQTRRDIADVVSTNLMGVIYCSRAVWAHMCGRSTGSIVNVGSAAQAGIRRGAVYSATKGGVASLTLSMALDAEEVGIRVNSILPSAGTAQSRHAAGSPDFRAEPEWHPDLVAPVVTYLLSDRSSNVCGQLFRVARGKISLWGHGGPVSGQDLRSESWSVEELAAAIADSFGDLMRRPGVPATDVAAEFEEFRGGHHGA